MKKYLEIKWLRNLIHYAVGFTFIYGIGKFTELFEMTGFVNIMCSCIVSIIPAGVLGGFYEKFSQVLDNERKYNREDVIRTAIGGAIGFGVGILWFQEYVFIALSIICICAFVLDVRMALNKRKM